MKDFTQKEVSIVIKGMNLHTQRKNVEHCSNLTESLQLAITTLKIVLFANNNVCFEDMMKLPVYRDALSLLPKCYVKEIFDYDVKSVIKK